MKWLQGIVLALCAVLSARAANIRPSYTVTHFGEDQRTDHVKYNLDKSENASPLLGAKQCTWGPSYWCKSFDTARECKAFKHCIPKEWGRDANNYESVCQVCKDMVQQARDQLESNLTQEELKEVFEGSCALLHFKPVVKECDQLVDDFVPQLVETLASQMNPSVVCSVAGLCDSARFAQLLKQYGAQSKVEVFKTSVMESEDKTSSTECTNCMTIANQIERKFSEASRCDVEKRFSYICGELGSFSDACGIHLKNYFNTLYAHLKSNLKAKSICHISGQCSSQFHVHGDDTNKTPAVEIRLLSDIGKVQVEDNKDDLPCKLCEQLVLHLRDLLVANTTEIEFQQVLEGICKQTKSFAPECKAIVDDYYPQIYNYLTEKLNGNAICQMGGLCPAPGKQLQSQPLWLMAPDAETAIKIREEEECKELTVEEIQLPLDRMSLPTLVVDDTHCSVCKFVMKYVEKNVRNLMDKDEVNLVLQEVKNSLPSIQGEAEGENFLNKYETALSVLILQGEDLSNVCPLVAVCPTNQQIEAWKSIPAEFTQTSAVENKPNCPLCLIALTKLEELVKDNKTEEYVKHTLDELCLKLPKYLTEQCIDLVKIYSDEIIQKLVQDMTPEEICAYLKLCKPQQFPHLHFGEKIVAVPQNDIEGKEACAFCSYVLHYIQTVITDPKAEDQVKKALSEACKVFPKSVKADCNEFVQVYGDAVVAVLVQEIDPSEVCPMLHICPSAELLESWKKISKNITIGAEGKDKPYCPLCLFGVTQLYNAIKDNKTEEAIKDAMEKLCDHVSTDLIDQCENFVKVYSEKIMNEILENATPQQVCVYLELCDPDQDVGPPISLFPLDKNGEIMSNEIPNYPVYTFDTEIIKPLKEVEVADVANDAECEVCKYVMKIVEQYMSTRRSKDEIEHMIHNVCNHLPKKMSQKCNNFVNEYAEIVIELITQEISPKEVCTIIDLCKPDPDKIKGEPDAKQMMGISG